MRHLLHDMRTAISCSAADMLFLPGYCSKMRWRLETRSVSNLYYGRHEKVFFGCHGEVLAGQIWRHVSSTFSISSGCDVSKVPEMPLSEPRPSFWTIFVRKCSEEWLCVSFYGDRKLFFVASLLKKAAFDDPSRVFYKAAQNDGMYGIGDEDGAFRWCSGVVG